MEALAGAGGDVAGGTTFDTRASSASQAVAAAAASIVLTSLRREVVGHGRQFDGPFGRKVGPIPLSLNPVP
jgi:hypothetical protein